MTITRTDRSACTHALAGHKTDAKKTLDELLAWIQTRYVPASEVAILWLSLGYIDAVLQWPQRALEEKALRLIYLKGEPRFDELRSKPRFDEILRRVGPIQIEPIELPFFAGTDFILARPQLPPNRHAMPEVSGRERAGREILHAVRSQIGDRVRPLRFTQFTAKQLLSSMRPPSGFRPWPGRAVRFPRELHAGSAGSKNPRRPPGD